MSMTVVIGANRGIGLELVRQLKERGEEVVAVCRSSSDQLAELNVRVVDGVDMTKDEEVDRLVTALEGHSIDLLINNAGVLTQESLEDLSFDRIRRQIEVNALGPLRVTAALLPSMDRGSKVAMVTSRMGSIDDNTSGGSYGYRMSKAALNMAGKSLAEDLKDRGIAVAILHPGFVRTDMTEGRGFVDPQESAAGLLARIDELTLETTGGFWHANGEPLPW